MQSLRDSVASTLSTPLAAITCATSRIAYGGATGATGSRTARQVDCCVMFLDGRYHRFSVEKCTTGGVLREKVLQFCGISNASKQYFGLQIVEDDDDKPYVRWLDAHKIVAKQVAARFHRRRPRHFRRHRWETASRESKCDGEAENYDENMLHGANGKASPAYTFQFGVRFYPEDPANIHDEYARYLIFLQLRRDMAASRLRASMPTAALLCSFVAEAELGDYDVGSNHDYESAFANTGVFHWDLLPPSVLENSSSSSHVHADFISKVQELHKTHAGQSRADAELCFLREARKLASYGLTSVFKARDAATAANPDVIIGVSHAGVLVFHAASPTQTTDLLAGAELIRYLKWSQVMRISFKRKHFVIEAQHLPPRTELIGFDLPDDPKLHARNVPCSAEPADATATHRQDQNNRQLDSAELHSASTVSSSGCSTSATPGAHANGNTHNIRCEYRHYEYSSRSGSDFSANNHPESDTAFAVVDAIPESRSDAVAKSSVQNKSRFQMRRSTTDSGNSGASDFLPRDATPSIATEADTIKAIHSALQQLTTTTTSTYNLESSEACEALGKQCLENQAHYRLEYVCDRTTLASSDASHCRSEQHSRSGANNSSAPLELLRNFMSIRSPDEEGSRFQKRDNRMFKSSRKCDAEDAGIGGESSHSSTKSFRNQLDDGCSNTKNGLQLVSDLVLKSQTRTSFMTADSPPIMLKKNLAVAITTTQVVAVSTPPAVTRSVNLPLQSGAPAAVWQMNHHSSPSKTGGVFRDAEVRQQSSSAYSVQPSHAADSCSRNTNRNNTTTVLLPAMSPLKSTTSVQTFDDCRVADNSCLSPLSPSAVNAVVTANGGDTDSKQQQQLLLKERRGMNIDKIDLPPNGSLVGDAFRVNNADLKFHSENQTERGSLICCRLKPDSEGRFGFNVLGRDNIRNAMVVTRVVPHSPADKAALREGDEIVSINGLSTHQRTYEEVATSIKECWMHPDNYNDSVGILDLVVRPSNSNAFCDTSAKYDAVTYNNQLQQRYFPAAVDSNRCLPSCMPPPPSSSQQQQQLMQLHITTYQQQQTPPSATVTPPALALWQSLVANDDIATAKAHLLSSADDAAISVLSHSNTTAPPDPSTLDGSMQILRSLLADPTKALLMSSFEQTYQKNADMRITHARLIGNIRKNRYRDVLPYDETRVLLRPMVYSPSVLPPPAEQRTTVADVKTNNNTAVVELIKEEDDDDEDDHTGDYVNASYIQMSIPTTDVVNHYIATQGPLASTTSDFWRMVWQEHASLIVMLTQLSEQGRPKCHQYWPALHKTLSVCGGVLQIVCNAECLIYDDSVSNDNENVDSSSASPSPTSTSSLSSSSNAYACRREFVVINRATREERHVTHLQYMAWPDHGVPSHDSIHFLQFVQEVRMRRNSSIDKLQIDDSPPTIIHCSAGVGRTGVLILMETAMCLIEAGEPVEPIAIVERMRDQRGMLIQTTAQYEFVLHCIVRAFDEKLVQPLPEHVLNAKRLSAKSKSAAVKRRAKLRRKAASNRRYSDSRGANRRNSDARQECSCCCQ